MEGHLKLRLQFISKKERYIRCLHNFGFFNKLIILGKHNKQRPFLKYHVEHVFLNLKYTRISVIFIGTHSNFYIFFSNPSIFYLTLLFLSNLSFFYLTLLFPGPKQGETICLPNTPVSVQFSRAVVTGTNLSNTNFILRVYT